MIDAENLAIPSCTQRDWSTAISIVSLADMKRLANICNASQGEINETTDGKSGYISDSTLDGPSILRGSNICLYVLREASQGKSIFLKENDYLNGKPDSVKARHHEKPRIGWQESSAQNNFRRIIAAKIPAGYYCNHKINYISEADSKIPLDFVLAILNSKISDWFFRLTSTNAAVSHYQIYSIPVPSVVKIKSADNWPNDITIMSLHQIKDLLFENCVTPGIMPQYIMEALIILCKKIQIIENGRILENRAERSSLAFESQSIQDVIDSVLFHYYGLSEDDGKYIEQRLREML